MKMKSLLSYVVLIVSFMIFALSTTDLARAQDDHQDQMRHEMPMSHGDGFRVTMEKPFPMLMDEAMAVMRKGMKKASRTGDPDHDFVTMMIPHH
jgi:uncharacterized protein (DUF305 family)